MQPRLTVAGKTDKGLVRTGNEDYLHIDHDNQVYAVFDGMGGHQAGEVASMTASQTVERAFKNRFRQFSDANTLSIDRVLPSSSTVLIKSIRLANRAVYTRASSESGMSGMGTTAVAVAFEADLMTIAHVGDSRAYRLKEKELEPLTKDHSWLVEVQENQQISEEEASSFVSKNVITRALGVKGTVEVDCRIVKVTAGDTIILCSDGLCGFADDDEIFDVARRSRDDINKMANDLVQMANDRGGSDNVTIVVITVDEVKESTLPEVEVFTQAAETDALSKEEDIWLKDLNGGQTADAEADTVTTFTHKSEKKTNPWVLVVLFLLFAVVAWWVIYMSQQP